MIIGCGIDLVEIDRIAKIHAKFGQRFLSHILSKDEISSLPARLPFFLASRFAAKEAMVKALGTGFSNGIVPTQISVLNRTSGKPFVVLGGSAAEKALELGVKNIAVSLSHERHNAIAMIILEN